MVNEIQAAINIPRALGLCDILATTMHSNGKLLGTFVWEKTRHCALVMVNICIHIAIIAVVSLTYSTPTCAITRIRLQYCMLTRAIKCIYIYIYTTLAYQIRGKTL